MIKLKDILKESLNEISKEQKIKKLIDFVKKYQNQLDENTQQQSDNTATFQLNQLSYNGQPLKGELVFQGGLVSNQDGNFTNFSDPNIPFNNPGWNQTIAQSGLEGNYKNLIWNIADELDDQTIVPTSISNYLSQISPNWDEAPNKEGIIINTNNIVLDVSSNLVDIINNYDALQPHAAQVANIITKALKNISTNKKSMDFTVDKTCQLTITNPNVFPNDQGGIYMWKQNENTTPLYIGKAGGNNPASSLRSYKNQYSQDRSNDREHTLKRQYNTQNTQPTRVKVNGKICKRIHSNPNDQLWFGVVPNNTLSNLVQNGINQELYNQYLTLPSPPARNIQTFFEDLLLTFYNNGNDLEINDDGAANGFNDLGVTRTNNQQNEITRMQELAGIIKEEDNEWEFDVDPWSGFSSEYQELEDKFGPNIANNIKIKYKDKFSSPKEFLDKFSMFEKFDPSKVDLNKAKEYFKKDQMDYLLNKNDDELLDFYEMTYNWQISHILNILEFNNDGDLDYYEFSNRENQDAFIDYLIDNGMGDDNNELDDIVYHANWWGFPQLDQLQNMGDELLSPKN